MSADWSMKPVPVPYANFGDPQSLNLYGYVRNTPTTRFDLDGHEDGFLDKLKAVWKSLTQPAADASASKASAPALDSSAPEMNSNTTGHAMLAYTNDKENQAFQVTNEVLAVADPTGQAAALNSELKGDNAGVALAVVTPLLHVGGAASRAILEEVRQQYDFIVWGYVVMPEHFHLLISEPTKKTVAMVMQVLKQRVSRRCRRKRKSANQMALWDAEPPRSFWQRRYYDFNVFSERKHVEKLHYMHRNPGSPASPLLACWGGSR